MNLHLLDSHRPHFPDPCTAAEEPDGLLAVGGNLFPTTVIDAYRQGIFPWYSDDDPILWWSPAIRCVIRPEQFHLSKSLRKCMRQNDYRVTTDTAFKQVIEACAAPRENELGTWIVPEMIDAYCAMHQLEQAHSIEVWEGEKLVGGIYGVAVGGIFCGESMFSGVTNGSKIAMAYLCRCLCTVGFRLLDCQIVNPHLLSLGAQSIDRGNFLDLLYGCRDQDLGWPETGLIVPQFNNSH
ncbi:leucyl/phenylalanyl-tRNA--protein transferase [SAR92 clade bacterium H921]|nr:leucyl/phenylalanyl-tRNA--protein transferase [SAR92 clade bacterium H921]